MDIAYYFNDQNNVNTHTCLNQLNQCIKDKTINLLEYGYMSEFLKENGSLKNASWMYELLAKIKNNKIMKNFCLLYPYIKDPKTVIDDLISSEKIFTFTKDQIEGFTQMIQTIYDYHEKTFGLFGYAGTGKTTIVIKLIYYLLTHKLVKKVAITAPTNKAVNVMKAKFRSCLNTKKLKEGDDFDEQITNVTSIAPEQIDFITIHKLLNYGTDVDVGGNRIFVQKGKSNILDYDLIIIDECSMLPLHITAHIYEEIRKATQLVGDNVVKIPKIIFSGDPAQLPPVGEKSSAIFSYESITFNDFLKSLPSNIANLSVISMGCSTSTSTSTSKSNGFVSSIKSSYENFINDLKTMKSTTMKTIVRNVNSNVDEMWFDLRQWVIGETTHPTIKNFIGSDIHLYKYNNGTSKTESLWFKKFMKMTKNNNQSDVSNIIITWTNKQTDTYNDHVRKILFGKQSKNQVPETYEVGDILMLNDFYNYNETPNEQNKFYTSEQIRVVNVEKTTFKCLMAKKPIKQALLKLKNSKNIISKLDECIKNINDKTKREYIVWKLKVHKIFDSTQEPYTIFTIHNTETDFLNKDKLEATKLITILRIYYKTNYKERLKKIDDLVIKPLWNLFDETFVRPIADINYGYSITTHKSQGSTFYNVFIDAHDILQNMNANEAKRCIYTSHTRASNKIYILI